jgi:hypothetical protein
MYRFDELARPPCRSGRGSVAKELRIMKLSQNVGTADRVARLGLGAVLGVLLLAGIVAAPLSYLVGVLSVIMLATGALGFCPIYRVVGMRTGPIQRV